MSDNGPRRHAIAPLGPSRRLTIDMLEAVGPLRTIHGLLEIDVTDALAAMRAHEAATGSAVSVTAWVARCVARAAADVPALRSRRVGRRVMIFDDVDLAVLVERTLADGAAPLPLFVRGADQKTVAEIQREIRAAQDAAVSTAGDLAGVGWSAWIPGLVRRAMFRAVSRSPRLAARFGAPIVVTAIGMFGGRGAGWGVPVAPFTLSVTVGSIVERLALIGGTVAAREHLCVTLSFDHDLVDGAPAARFAARLRELMASVPDGCEDAAPA